MPVLALDDSEVRNHVLFSYFRAPALDLLNKVLQQQQIIGRSRLRYAFRQCCHLAILVRALTPLVHFPY